MATRSIVWTKTADLQLVGVLKYWINRNKSNKYSLKLLNIVTERTKQIAQNPLIFKATDFKDTRIASLGNYSIFYQVHGDKIIITAFWDNRQDPKKLLKILKDLK